MRTPSLSLLLMLAVVIAACAAPESSGDALTAEPSATDVDQATPEESTAATEGPTPSASAAELVFTSEQLCDLMLTESDVPPEAAPNPETAEDEARCLRGFSPDGDPFPGIISGAYLFADAAEAREEAEGFVDVVTENANPPYIPFDADESGLELGDAAYCFLRQYEETPSAVTYASVGCYWAIGNVVLSVTYSNDEPVAEDDALRLAEIMQRRAAES